MPKPDPFSNAEGRSVLATLDRTDWDSARKDYENHTPRREICLKHGCSLQALEARARRERWIQTSDSARRAALLTRAKTALNGSKRTKPRKPLPEFSGAFVREDVTRTDKMGGRMDTLPPIWRGNETLEEMSRDGYAVILSEILNGHQAFAGEARRQFVAMQKDLATLEPYFGQLEIDPDDFAAMTLAEKLTALMDRLRTIAARAETLNKLVLGAEKAVDMERRALNLDSPAPGTASKLGYDGILDELDRNDGQLELPAGADEALRRPFPKLIEYDQIPT